MEEEVIKHEPKEKITKGWHLDKRISVAHFFATFAFATALASAIYTIKNDIEDSITDIERDQDKHEAVAELEFKGINAQLHAVRERDTAFKLEIIRRLERIEDGIDRHIETTNLNHLDR